MNENAPTVLDLFAGCGGFSKGFEKAGFRILLANEIWHDAVETYRRNHPNAIMVEGDITDPKIKAELIDKANGKIDVIIGGPPCQAYSMAGLRDPNDPRGRLFEDYVDIVRHIKPKLFVLENVKGILSMKHDKGGLKAEDKNALQKIKSLEEEKAALLLQRKRHKNNPERFPFSQEELRRLEAVKKDLKKSKAETGGVREKVTDLILKRFSEIGYTVHFKVLNSADFGVPQKRQRVIFIGSRNEHPPEHPMPTHAENALITIDGRRLKPWKTVKEAIDDLKNTPEDKKKSHILTEHNTEFLQKVKKTPIGKSVFGGYSDAFFRAPPNEPSRTVKENHGGVLVHYEKDRVMTPRELARLQSFDDDFLFYGTKSSVLKQIGNAVPVGLAKAIAEKIKAEL